MEHRDRVASYVMTASSYAGPRRRVAPLFDNWSRAVRPATGSPRSPAVGAGRASRITP